MYALLTNLLGNSSSYFAYVVPNAKYFDFVNTRITRKFSPGSFVSGSAVSSLSGKCYFTHALLKIRFEFHILILNVPKSTDRTWYFPLNMIQNR